MRAGAVVPGTFSAAENAAIERARRRFLSCAFSQHDQCGDPELILAGLWRAVGTLLERTGLPAGEAANMMRRNAAVLERQGWPQSGGRR